MENERGIRVSERVRDKVKVAALYNGLTMNDYIDGIVPEIKLVEMPK